MGLGSARAWKRGPGSPGLKVKLGLLGGPLAASGPPPAQSSGSPTPQRGALSHVLSPIPRLLALPLLCYFSASPFPSHQASHPGSCCNLYQSIAEGRAMMSSQWDLMCIIRNPAIYWVPSRARWPLGG